MAYDFLMTTPSKSVEYESALSLAGLFSTKIKSRSGNQSLDKLYFLHAYLLKRIVK